MNAMAQMSTAFQDEIPNYKRNVDDISSLPISNRRVRVLHPNSLWVRQLESRFEELVTLPVGWDGYFGQPVSFSCAQFAANLIEQLHIDDVPPPQLVPGSDGGIQLEWHRNDFDLEIEIHAPYDVVASRVNLQTGQEEEIEIQTDFTNLAEWVVQLSHNEAWN